MAAPHEKPLTPAMQDIRFWLPDGVWVEQVKLYDLLGKAQNVGVTLNAMHKRGLVERAFDGRRWLWRWLATDADRAEYQRRRAILRIAQNVHVHLLNAAAPQIAADMFARIAAYRAQAEQQQAGLPAPTHEPSPTLH